MWGWCTPEIREAAPSGTTSKRGRGVIYASTRHVLRTVNRWFARRYNVNNAWNFNGTNGNINNNNVNNAYRCQAVLNLLKRLYTL